MEKKTIGAFLSALRKANGMTQQEVADKLNVSNKTVSKWERDEGCPEIMMLPAIAELYSVTVDEILRGERITKSESTERKNEKSEERVKYLVEKASVKFTNCSIVSLVMGAVAFLLSYTVGGLVSYNYLWTAYLITLVLISASVTVMLVAFNSFFSGVENAKEIGEADFEDVMKKSIKHVSAAAFLALVSLQGFVISVIVDVPPDFIFILLPLTASVSIVGAYYMRLMLYKKYKIADDGNSPAQKQYRKKHVRITVIIIAVVAAVSMLLPFICCWVESSSHAIFSFSDGVGYQYETEEEAEREYYKLKDFVTGKKVMYTVVSGDDCYLDENGKYVLTVEQLGFSYEEKENGYSNVGNNLFSQENLYFATVEEAEEFKQENVIEDTYIACQRNITFDDESFSVSYQTENDNFWNGVSDIMPVFLIAGGGSAAVVFVVSVIVYFYNKKKIA